ncbi:MAG: chemotaxis protein CheW [Spirochaetota bacterium]|jgi:purine-binding chemotaxis protein CheW|nr:chemotaxis protein CheW [Spirochaetota bacterium]
MNDEQVMTMAQDSSLQAMQLQVQPGKYLTYRLGDEQYGIEIGKVQEIIGLMPMTRVPRTPDCVRGVINLRGKVIPVVDLRMKFGLNSVEDTRKTCIIVMHFVQADRTLLTLGIVVDEVSEVAEFSRDQLQPQPAFGTKVMANLILGIGRIGERVVIILDADRLVTPEEISVIDSMA